MSFIFRNKSINLIKLNKKFILLNESIYNKNSLSNGKCLFRSYTDKTTDDSQYVKEFRLDDEWHDVYATKKSIKQDKNESISINLDHDDEIPKFTKLLRNSDLVNKGYIKNGFVTTGIIKNVMNDTIFIDYGGKFQLITQKPEKDSNYYVRGAEVLIKITDWELTARFIGSTTDSTLCESGGKILQLINSPANITDDHIKLKKDTKQLKIDNYLKNLDLSIDDRESFDDEIKKNNELNNEKLNENFIKTNDENRSTDKKD